MTSTATRNTVKILVADDDPHMLEFVAMALSRLGYEVSTAPDGEAALRAFEQAPRSFHLVIADAVMPRLGGLELLRAVSILSPSTLTLLISGSPELVARTKTAALPKPFAVAALASTVNALLTHA
jgi:two-component system OmpR family response regulator